MTNDLSSERSRVPEFYRWESPETRIRWERGLAIIAGMIGVVLVFFLLIAVIPLSAGSDRRPIAGLQSISAGAAVVAPEPAAPAPTQAPPPQEQRLTGVSRAAPNVRRGPGINAPILTNLRQGQRVEVTGRSTDNQWLQILHPENSREKVWVSADMLDVTGDARTLPEARAE